MVTAAADLGRRLRARPAAAAAAAAVVAAVAAVAAVVAVARTGEGDVPRGGRGAAGPTAPVERGDIVVRETVGGTLGYGAVEKVLNRLRGTITRLPAAGGVVRRGQALYDVDGRPGAFLMYGGTPAWRSLDIRSSDGIDVRQLEWNLVRLGYDPHGEVEVDDDFDSATARTVKRWQKAQGLPQTGAVELGRVVFASGPRRIAAVDATEGAPAGPGLPVLTVTGTEPTVTVELDADKRAYVSVGDTVTVELPSGRVVSGRISSIGRVARKVEDGAVIDVQVALARGAKVPDLDQSPVSVGIVAEAKRNVLRVPVTALLARRGGGYAVEVVRDDGRRQLVAVQPGLYADGYVEIVRGRLAEGDRVVVAE